MVDAYNADEPGPFAYAQAWANDPTVVLCLSSTNQNAMQSVRRLFMALQEKSIQNPVVLITDSQWRSPDEHLIHFATETGGLCYWMAWVMWHLPGICRQPAHGKCANERPNLFARTQPI